MKLEVMNKDAYEGDYRAHLLEQWKVCVDMANANSERRISSNHFYISLVGMITCVLWFNAIESYKRLNSVKSKIINHIEKQLPISPHGYEWIVVKFL